MNIISKFKLFEGKDFESIKIGNVSLQDIYDYLYEDDRILYDLIKEKGKIRTFNTVSKVCPEFHRLIIFSDLYEDQLYSKGRFRKDSQFSECFSIEIDIDISNKELSQIKNPYDQGGITNRILTNINIKNILRNIMLPIKSRFNFNIYYLSINNKHVERLMILLVPFS